MDYSLYQRDHFGIDSVADVRFDVFLSCHNDSERVHALFGAVSADRKILVLQAEYGYNPDEVSTDGEIHSLAFGDNEFGQWLQLLDSLQLDVANCRLAIDITGMMRPAVLVLPLVLKHMGFMSVSIYYTEPSVYAKGTATQFAKGNVRGVSTIPGTAGLPLGRESEGDLLIVGAGYDQELVSAVLESRRAALQLLLVGLPGLQPHMYQESLYQLSLVREEARDGGKNAVLYAPASDPFMTAQVISDEVRRRGQHEKRDLYLSPLGAKSQVLGFAWFYALEGRVREATIVFPYSDSYSRETSLGVGRVNRFVLEFGRMPEL